MSASPGHVCLVTPGQLSTNPRLVKEADCLTEHGFRVTVVTGRFLRWAVEADTAFDGRPWTRIEVPFGPQSSRSRWLRQTLVRHLARALIRTSWTSPTLLEELAYHPAVSSLTSAARTVKADLYIAHNLAALPAAGRAAEAHGAALGFDAEDDHVGELPNLRSFEAERRLRTRIQRRWIAKAGHLTAASPGIARACSQRFERTFVPILNTFPRSWALTENHEAATQNLYWFSQTIGPGRGLETAIDVVGNLGGRVQLALRGHPATGFREAVEARLRFHGLPETTCTWLPIVPPDQIVEACRGFTAGLSVEVTSVENRALCLTNKIFVYLLAKLPVILSDTPSQVELAQQLGGAALLLPWGDTRKATASLASWLDDAPRRAAARDMALHLAMSRFNWEVESQAFLQSVHAALAGPRRSAA